MERELVHAKLQTIMRETFANDNISINDATTAQDVTEWDSLGHLNLMMAIEKNFGVSLTAKEVRNMRHVGDLIGLVEKKMAARNNVA
jgi:acyl carrier protein